MAELEKTKAQQYAEIHKISMEEARVRRKSMWERFYDVGLHGHDAPKKDVWVQNKLDQDGF